MTLVYTIALDMVYINIFLAHMLFATELELHGNATIEYQALNIKGLLNIRNILRTTSQFIVMSQNPHQSSFSVWVRWHSHHQSLS
jgi:hypothetical protein